MHVEVSETSLNAKHRSIA